MLTPNLSIGTRYANSPALPTLGCVLKKVVHEISYAHHFGIFHGGGVDRRMGRNIAGNSFGDGVVGSGRSAGRGVAGATLRWGVLFVAAGWSRSRFCSIIQRGFL